MTKIKRTKR